MQINMQRGFTLMEVMISLAIGVFLLGGVTAAYLAMRSATTETVSISEIQQNGRMAIALLSADIQQAGFSGMLSDLGSITAAPAAFAGDCNSGLNGGSFPQAASGNFPSIWGVTMAAAGNVMGCVVNAAADSDVIQVKRGGGPPVVAGAMQANRFYLESNSAQGAIFPGTAAAPGFNLGEIWSYFHHVYYVTTEVFDGNAIPVLARMELVNNGGPVMQQNMLLDGIERIRFYYGIDSNDDNVVDSYIAPNNMPATLWQANAQLKAVKIYVLARASRPDVNYQNLNTYDLGDGVAFTPQDNFRRLLFSTTVSIQQ